VPAASQHRAHPRKETTRLRGKANRPLQALNRIRSSCALSRSLSRCRVTPFQMNVLFGFSCFLLLAVVFLVFGLFAHLPFYLFVMLSSLVVGAVAGGIGTVLLAWNFFPLLGLAVCICAPLCIFIHPIGGNSSVQSSASLQKTKKVEEEKRLFLMNDDEVRCGRSSVWRFLLLNSELEESRSGRVLRRRVVLT